MPRFTATYDDGTTFEGGLTDGSFHAIDQSRLRSFAIDHDGAHCALDLKTGFFSCPDGSVQMPPIPPAPRLIAYATMRGATGQSETLHAYVVGWQATVPVEGQWRNVKLGLRVIPSEGRWTIGDDI